jgi:hypothetical protein
MRRKLPLLALMTILVIGGLVATSGPASAGDGYARHLQQQARDREKARLHDQARLRDQARARQQAPSRNRSSAPKSAGASKAGTAWRSIRPGTASTTR